MKKFFSVIMALFLLFGVVNAQAATILERIGALEAAVGLAAEDDTLEGRLRFMETQLGITPADGATFEQRITALEAMLGLGSQATDTAAGSEPAGESAVTGMAAAAEPGVLAVDPIATVATQYPAYEDVTHQAKEVEFLTFTGQITKTSDEFKHQFYAQEGGIYHFEATGLLSGFTISLYLYDENGDRLDFATNRRNGDGLTMSLQKGKTYTLKVQGYTGTGSYTVSVGTQKPTLDISSFTMIKDATEFKEQAIRYDYTPEVNGTYRFYISQVNSGITFSIYVYDDAGYQVDYKTNVSKDGGLNVTLNAHKPYRVVVRPYTSLGPFTLSVGPQQQKREVSGYTSVTDTIRYSGQKQYYEYIPKVSGRHRFELGQVESGFSVSMFIYDSSGYRLDYKNNVKRGNGLTMNLTAGETYKLAIEQYSGYGTFPLLIGPKKQIPDITGYTAVRDSVQYTDQVNSYTFTPDESRNYTFQFDEIASGLAFSLYIYDDGGYTVDYATNMRQGRTLSVSLKAGVQYKISVNQSSGLGTYTLRR